MNDKKLKGDLGEDFVNQFAFKSLLKYWCYPNPKDEKGDKKEICDLLVLFKSTCIIFSVKNYDFDGNYEKYNKKTVEKAIKQISGAERKLFDYPRDIYIKHPERKIEKFEKGNFNEVYRIVVNLGAGVDIYNPAYITEKGSFITIFNKDTLETILGELDTISDFKRYLTAREEFISSKVMMQWLGREKDLFALYIRHARKFPPEFTKESHDNVIVDFEGEWDKFLKEDKEPIKQKKHLDKDSYFLVDLFERELTRLPQGDLLAQEFFSLDRFERRTFANLFSEFFKIHQNRSIKSTGHRYVEIGDYGVVFFYYSPDLMNANFPEVALQTALIGYAMHTNYSKKKMLGFGTTFEMRQFKFQFIEMDHPLDKEVIKQTNLIIDELGWFQNVKSKRYQDQEYPDK